MNTEPRRPPSGVSRLRTSAKRPWSPNEASAVEAQKLPSDATCTSAESPRRPKEASAGPSPPNKASALEQLRLLSEPLRLPSNTTRTSAEPPSEASTEPQGRPKAAPQASAAEPMRHEASNEPPRLLGRPREASTKPSPPNKASAAEPQRPPSDAWLWRIKPSAQRPPNEAPNEASAAEPLRPPSGAWLWGIKPSLDPAAEPQGPRSSAAAAEPALDPAPPGRISMMTARPYERANGNGEFGAAEAEADEGAEQSEV